MRAEHFRAFENPSDAMGRQAEEARLAKIAEEVAAAAAAEASGSPVAAPAAK